MGNVSLISRNILENQQYICDEYLEGKSIKSLIEEFNSSHRTIRSILEINKVTIRSSFVVRYCVNKSNKYIFIHLTELVCDNENILPTNHFDGIANNILIIQSDTKQQIVY